MRYIKFLSSNKTFIGELTIDDNHFVVDLDENYKEYDKEINEFLKNLINRSEHYLRKGYKADDKTVERQELVKNQEELIKSLAYNVTKNRFSFGRMFAVIGEGKDGK